jgi:hypothetical protein
MYHKCVLYHIPAHVARGYCKKSAAPLPDKTPTTAKIFSHHWKKSAAPLPKFSLTTAKELPRPYPKTAAPLPLVLCPKRQLLASSPIPSAPSPFNISQKYHTFLKKYDTFPEKV